MTVYRALYALLLLSYLLFAHAAFAVPHPEGEHVRSRESVSESALMLPAYSVITRDLKEAIFSIEYLLENPVETVKLQRRSGLLFILHKQGSLHVDEQAFDAQSITELMN